MAKADKNDKNEILLESGTNEIEIMEFTIAGNLTESTWRRSTKSFSPST